MPRYGIVQADGVTLSDVILIPEARKMGSARQADAITELQQRAAAASDGSRVVEFSQLPWEKDPAQRQESGDALEWDDAKSEPVINKAG